ncbi:uncharacterized protein M421DRAFT_402854 [Didymella exigua CBS 183.55]|uniref:SET domain-containing protein n=1 Tax=Didymella exigua CBS 183.55 TaxID=1150837 RepID=A0A6A5RXJ5_9PLEO|nr:uncharacterized protein M421DRAFT_402854 [Didymella exigua CBS 183.55]KAF1932070.1 hypothetical protein M421DRAFT_402854 [Didymella exigua CBS 183.55]
MCGKPVSHYCLGKYCWQGARSIGGFFCQEDTCDHTFSEWLTGAEGWEERFEISAIPDMGYGLHSKQEWEKVLVGPEFSKTSARVAYVDAEHCENYTRFCNHSCDNNENTAEARAGKERVLVLKAEKDTAVGEQITVDYDSDYFTNRKCLCGSARCKYPDAVNAVSVSGLRCSVKKASQLGHDRAIRYDSVSEPDEMEMV